MISMDPEWEEDILLLGTVDDSIEADCMCVSDTCEVNGECVFSEVR